MPTVSRLIASELDLLLQSALCQEVTSSMIFWLMKCSRPEGLPQFYSSMHLPSHLYEPHTHTVKTSGHISDYRSLHNSHPQHSTLMSEQPAAATFSNQQSTWHVQSQEHINGDKSCFTAAGLQCWTIYIMTIDYITYDTTSATDNSTRNQQHF